MQAFFNQHKKPILTTAFILLATLGMVWASQGDLETLEKIKTGEVALYCNMKGQDFKRIDPVKVTKVDEIDGRWHFVFTNGWASQCYMEHQTNQR